MRVNLRTRGDGLEGVADDQPLFADFGSGKIALVANFCPKQIGLVVATASTGWLT